MRWFWLMAAMAPLLAAPLRHTLRLEAGQFVRGEVDQAGTDLRVRVRAPGGRLVAERDCLYESGAEPVSFIAPAAGVYAVDVLPAGRFVFRVAEQRAPAAADEQRINAEIETTAAKRLLDGDNATNMQAAVEKLRHVEVVWRALGERVLEAQAVHGQGFVQARLATPKEALLTLTRALELRRAARDPYGEAETLTAIAYLRSAQGEKQQAIALYQQALALYRAGGFRRREASLLNNLAAVYGSLGELKKAVEHSRAALGILEAAPEPVIELQALNGLVAACSALGERQQALIYAHRAAPLAQALRNPRSAAYLLVSMARLYYDLGEPEQGLAALERALPRMREAGDARGELTVLINGAVILQRLGQKPAAAKRYTEALSGARRVADRHTEAAILTNLGQLQSDEGDRKGAVETLRQALALASEVGDRRLQGVAEQNLAGAHYHMKQPEEAAAHATRALEHARAAGVRDVEVRVLTGLARLARNAGDLASARARAGEATRLTESLRTAVAGPELRASYFATVRDIFDFSIDLAIHEGQQAAALEYAERARARSLLDSLAEAAANIREGVDPALAARERALQRAVNAATGKQLDQAIGQLREVQGQIRASSPRYAALTQPEPLKADEIRQLLGPDTMLFQYALGEERSYLWAVTRDSLAAYPLPPRAEIEGQARRVYELLAARQHAEFPKAARTLSQWLLGPVAARLANQRLLIAAEGALHYIPFGALPDPRSGRPLIEAHEIVYTPSASSLAVLRRETAGRQSPPKLVAVLADPVVEAGDPRLNTRAATSQKERYSRLLFSGREANAILALAPPEQRLRAVGFDASRQNAASPALGNYRIVHIASHGVLNSRYPEMSGIVLSLRAPDGRPQDGFLRLHEVYNLKLPVDLVVLSACQTALGKEIRGEGLVGLTRGFMYAGAARVVASLWKVDDQSTSELMRHFYQRMLNKPGLTAAAALREAQNVIRNDPRWSAPYHWAPFVLQGEWR